MSKRLCMSLLAAGVLAVGATGQQGTPLPLQQRKAPPPPHTIHLDVVVTSKSGVPVGGLEEKDFTVLDNKEVQTITSFQAHDGQNEPLDMIVLIDDLNSGFDVIAQERFGIASFLHSNDGKLAHPTSLAILTYKGVEMQGTYSRDGNALSDSLDKYTVGLRTIRPSAGAEGEAEILQGSLNALRMLVTYESTRPGRKLILWVSPGWPLLSGPNIDLTYKQQEGVFNEITWLSTQLRESQTTIYNVNPLGVDEGPGRTFLYEEYLNGVTKPGDDAMGNLALQVIATETGGLVLSSSDIAASLKQCAADTGAYYRISFEPPPAKRRDVYHRVEVKVAERGLTARTSTGYYAEP